MSTVAALARRLGADERTLRRAVEQGAVRGERGSPRRFEVPPEEERYLQQHWPLLSALRKTLRTEPSVRLAVLFGSAATGETKPASDVDLLVSTAPPEPFELARLALRLRAACGLRVHLLSLDDAVHAPSLLADALEEGRVLVDRDGLWGRLKATEEGVRSAALRDEEATARLARAAVSACRSRLH